MKNINLKLFNWANTDILFGRPAIAQAWARTGLAKQNQSFRYAGEKKLM
jgi:hypothetical protein